MKSLAVICFVTLMVSSSVGQEYPKPCENDLYCYGPLLHHVNMANPRLFKDSKSFVDMPLKNDKNDILREFEVLLGESNGQPSQSRLSQFVAEHFSENATEFETWVPDDFQPDPVAIRKIEDKPLRDFAYKLNSFWSELGRKIKLDVKDNNRTSMIYVENPVIVPGGRFKEFYYWDSYWIQKGLLVSEMYNTVRGMIHNFRDMVKSIGFIPNGGRVYYQRSQPPLFIPMVYSYYDATEDIQFVEEILPILKQEFAWFVANRSVTFQISEKNYTMFRYNVEMDGPRPESYREDYELAQYLNEWLKVSSPNMTEDEREVAMRELQFNMKSGAESGLDFSSRWYSPYPIGHQKGDLVLTKTRNLIPADLNSYMYWNARILKEFCKLINKPETCSAEEQADYEEKEQLYKANILEVLWDETEGSWFDYDIHMKELRKEFYPTNLAPLWVKGHHQGAPAKIVQYLKKNGIHEYPGGVPTSLLQTGQQWDFPNGWAPLQHLFVEALEYSENEEARELAFATAQKWVQSNHKAYATTEHMFEKYDVTTVGYQGGGGEYEVVVGFGWSNGVILDFLKMYGDRIVSLEEFRSGSSTLSLFSIVFLAVSNILLIFQFN